MSYLGRKLFIEAFAMVLEPVAHHGPPLTKVPQAGK